MPGYFAIKLTSGTLGSVLASLSDTPAGKARFMHACLVYPYEEGKDVYFVRGNYNNKSGVHTLDDHLFNEERLSNIFDWSSSDGKQRKNANKPDGNWFVVFIKGSHLIDTLYDLEGEVIARKPRGELREFLKKSGGRYSRCLVQPYESDTTMSVQQYKREFNGEQVLEGKQEETIECTR